MRKDFLEFLRSAGPKGLENLEGVTLRQKLFDAGGFQRSVTEVFQANTGLPMPHQDPGGSLIKGSMGSGNVYHPFKLFITNQNAVKIAPGIILNGPPINGIDSTYSPGVVLSVKVNISLDSNHNPTVNSAEIVTGHIPPIDGSESGQTSAGAFIGAVDEEDGSIFQALHSNLILLPVSWQRTPALILVSV